MSDFLGAPQTLSLDFSQLFNNEVLGTGSGGGGEAAARCRAGHRLPGLPGSAFGRRWAPVTRPCGGWDLVGAAAPLRWGGGIGAQI